MTVSNSKEVRFNRVAESALKTIERCGLEGFSVAQVARLSRVSRAWIYKYIGPKREDIVDMAVDYYGRRLALLDERRKPQNPKQWRESVMNGTEKLLEQSAECPWLILLYFRYRGTPTSAGRRIDRVESQYLKVFAEEVQLATGIGPRYSLFLAKSFLGVRMGLAHQWVTSESKHPKEKEKLIELVEAVLKRFYA